MPSFRDIVFTISSISDVSEVFPVIIWLRYARRNRTYQFLGIFLILTFLTRVYSLLTAEMQLNNMHAYHLLALLEIMGIYGFVRQISCGSINLWGVWILIIVHVGNALLNEGLWKFNALAWTIDMLLVILLGFFYFYKIYTDESDLTPLNDRPEFIIISGWLLYAAGSLFTYLMGSKILTGYAEGFFKNGWFFQTISNIAKNLIVGYAFWLTGKK